jgi:hypothetical protein
MDGWVVVVIIIIIIIIIMGRHISDNDNIKVSVCATLCKLRIFTLHTPLPPTHLIKSYEGNIIAYKIFME